MYEENNIDIIRNKYKEELDVDVTIKYDEENGVYLIVDEDGKVLNKTTDLEEFIDKLNEKEEQEEKVQSPSSVSNVGSSSNNTSSKTSIARAKNNDEKVMDTNINMFFSEIMEVTQKLASMNDEVSNCNLNYSSCLSGELASYYATLNDTTKENILKLSNIISSLSIATETSLSLCYETSNMSLKELEELINELYNQTDEFVNTINDSTTIIEDESIGYDDYAYMFDNMGELFDGRYKDILDKFYLNLSIGYQNFLKDTVPETLNNIIENTYLRISDEEIGSKAYLEKLEKYKESFGLKILNEYQIDVNNYDIENSNIPEYLWEDSNNYNKALLVLSYDGTFDSKYEETFKDSIWYACHENNLKVIDDATFASDVGRAVESFSVLKEYYNRDYDNEFKNLTDEKKVKEIIEITKKLREGLLFENDRVSTYTTEVLDLNIGMDADKSKLWVESIKELGYFDNLTQEYTEEDLYKNTFNYEFLTNISVNEGTDKVYQIMEGYYSRYLKECGFEDYEEKAREIAQAKFQEDGVGSFFTSANISSKLLQNIDNSYNVIVNDKLTLDASKSSFKLGLLESLDTADITDADVNEARKIIGNDAKYLEDWQIKGYYKIYQSDQERAKNLLDDTLYNIIQDGRGYEKAASTYNLMTGEEQKKLLNGITHNEIFNDIWGKTSGFVYTGLQGFSDGAGNSLRNVADLFVADGKMDANDYYLMHLQEMLSAGGIHNDILKLTYNASSSVGNMAPAMALSAFVSPAAMSGWIFASTVGSEREKTLRSGEEENFSTWFNASAKGLLAVGVEKVLGSLKGYGAKSDDLLKIFTDDTKFADFFMSSGFGRKFALGLSNSVNETIEELVENAGGYGIDFLTGKDIDWQNIPQETWETIYMTMVTTPFINLMGEGFQNNKHSLINKMNTYNFNGFDAEYSQAELMKYTDKNGNVDKQAFFNYLLNNNKIKNINKFIENVFESYKKIDKNIDGNNDAKNNESNDIKRIINGIMSKENCSREDAVKILEVAIKNNDYNFITRNGDARAIASKYTSDQLNEMLLTLKNTYFLGNQHELLVDITRKNDDLTYKTPSELFEEIREKFIGASYGVKQGGLLGLATFIDENGNVISERDAMKRIRECKEKGLPLPHFEKDTSIQYNFIRNYLVVHYGMSESDASVLLTSVDDEGACSYASVANEIFTSFIGKEQEFQEKFGFPMFDENIRQPNYNLLLADMYLNYNSDELGGKLLTIDFNGNLVLNKKALSGKLDSLGRPILDASKQRYLSTAYSGKNVDLINRYLGMKGIEYKSSILKKYDNHGDNKKIRSLAKTIQDGLKNGKSYSMGVYSGRSSIHLVSTDGWDNQKIDGGHSVFISNVTDDGIIVASWGNEYLIPFSDLENKKSNWIITESDIIVKY